LAELSLKTNNLPHGTSPFNKINQLEHLLGPENYRIVKGLLRTPASILGFILIGLFVLIALLAPVIAPPVGRPLLKNSPRRIPGGTAPDDGGLGKRSTAPAILVETDHEDGSMGAHPGNIPGLI
jgi:hypothetical protein